METQKLATEYREALGKGPSRRMRTEGRIPAVVYGQNEETIPIWISEPDLRKLLLSKWETAIVDLKVDGKVKKECNVIIKDIQSHDTFRAATVASHHDTHLPALDRAAKLPANTHEQITSFFRTNSSATNHDSCLDFAIALLQYLLCRCIVNAGQSLASLIGAKVIVVDLRINNVFDSLYTTFGYVWGPEPTWIPAATRSVYGGVTVDW